MRIARKPRNGFASGPMRCGSPGSGLSPPTSSVRIVTPAGASPATISRYAAYCWSSLGTRVELRKRYSVRYSPTPSAWYCWTSGTSSGFSMLARRTTDTPSCVSAGSSLTAISRVSKLVLARWILP